MDLKFLHQIDLATLNLEQARRDLELAKSVFETAKQEHESVLAKSEEFGVNRSKVRKLAEDRVQALFESGLLATSAIASSPVVRQAKPKKLKREKDVEEVNLHSVDEVETPAALHS